MNLVSGDLENIIMNALWNMEENDQNSLGVAEILDKINTKKQNWAYTTIKTVVDRLVDKGLVKRFKSGKKYFYQTTIPRYASGEEAIKKLARQYYNDDVEQLLKAVEKVYHEALVYV
jgi:predicted transcriptional regulator